MDDQQLISHIEELGLSNKEARVYVALLKIGPSPVQQIADRSEIKRVTTYVILESLGSLGLVTQSIRGKKTYFVAEDPSNLKRLLEKREQELAEQTHNFDQVLPQLQSLKTIPKEMPEVKFYEGSEAVRTLFGSLFADYRGNSKSIYVISNIDDVSRFLPELSLGKPNLSRLKYNIKSHIIYTSAQGPVYHKTDKENNRESRYVPTDKFPLTGELSILDEYIVMTSFNSTTPVGVAIRNRDLAQSFKTIFNMCWEQTREFNPESED